MTPIQFAYDNGHKLVISFIRNLAGIDDSNSNSFNEYAKFSGNLFIKNKKAEVSDDDDFLKLEDEANKDSGEEFFEDLEDNRKASDLESFDPSDEKRRLKYGVGYDHPKIIFSSEENSDFERDTSYMSNYVKSILTPELYNEFKTAQEKGLPLFKMIEMPESLKRPFQITKDYADLIIDLMNELIESDDLKGVEYDDYIEKLSTMFLTENHDDHHKPKEDSHKVVIDAYKDAFKKFCGLECAEFVFERSDQILKEQLCDVVGIGCERPPENSELETVVIDLGKKKEKKEKKIDKITDEQQLSASPIFAKSSPFKNQLVCPEPPKTPPPPPTSSPPGSPRDKEELKTPKTPPSSPHITTNDSQSAENLSQQTHEDSLLDSPHKIHQDSLLESPSQSQPDSLFESADQSLFESPIESPFQSPNQSLLDDPQNFQNDDLQQQDASLEMIDLAQLEQHIRAILPKDVFEQFALKKLEGKLPDMIPNEENDEVIDAVNLYAQMDNLSEYTYDEYIKHLVNAYLNNGEEEEEEFYMDAADYYSKENLSDDN